MTLMMASCGQPTNQTNKQTVLLNFSKGLVTEFLLWNEKAGEWRESLQQTTICADYGIVGL